MLLLEVPLDLLHYGILVVLGFFGQFIVGEEGDVFEVFRIVFHITEFFLEFLGLGGELLVVWLGLLLVLVLLYQSQDFGGFNLHYGAIFLLDEELFSFLSFV